MCEPATITATLSSVANMAAAASLSVAQTVGTVGAGVGAAAAANPLTAAALTSSAVGSFGQYQQGKATRRNAREAYNLEKFQIQMRADQEATASADRQQDIKRQAAEQSSEVRAQAGEAGVTGLSVQDVASSINRNRGEALARERSSLDNIFTQLEVSGFSAGNRFTQRTINSTSPAQAIMGFASDAIQIRRAAGG